MRELQNVLIPVLSSNRPILITRHFEDKLRNTEVNYVGIAFRHSFLETLIAARDVHVLDRATQPSQVSSPQCESPHAGRTVR